MRYDAGIRNNSAQLDCCDCRLLVDCRSGPLLGWPRSDGRWNDAVHGVRGRARKCLQIPFASNQTASFFGASPATFSLPSGHALLSLCFYGSLGGLLAAPLGTRARAAIFTLLALLVIGIGLSRVYLGVHYLSDVVAGYFLASFWIAVFWSWWGSEGPRRK
jgi:membrane-associated phospholipid phosphatase